MTSTEMISFEGIPEFVEVVRKGSFTAAAKNLGITKSGVGRMVSRLEARLGFKLLHRTTRKLVLTADGEAYFATCARTLDELARTEDAIRGGFANPVGRLRVDLPAAFGRLHVLPHLLDIMAKYPDLQITATFTDRRVDIIDEGIDLAIRIGPVPNSTELSQKILATQTLILCAAPSYLARHGEPLRKEDLAEHRCIVGYRNNSRHSWVFQDERGQLERFPIANFYELGDGEAMLAAAVGGRALAQLPTWLAGRNLADGSLVQILPSLSGAHSPITAFWPRAGRTPVKVRLLVDSLLAHFEGKAMS